METMWLTGDALWERMDRAVEKVRERLERSTSALSRAGIPYAVIGGNAVRAWVAQADEAAVRTTRDVDLLLRRTDLPAAQVALEQAGFVYRHSSDGDMFLDGPDAKARDAVHVLLANEKVHEDDLVAAPDVTDVTDIDGTSVLTLESLVRMKLNVFRNKDRMHLRDMLDVELINPSWRERFSPELSRRLQELIDDPRG